MITSVHGLLLVDKPSGCTSHDVVQFVRWALHERAVGHTGTLDPAATGMLVLLVGAATGLAPWLGEDDKRYHARFVLGRATTTADAEGETIATAPCDDATFARALDELSRMTGPLELAPPSVSAIKVAGKRAHDRVRAGEDVVLPARAMRVDAVTIAAIDRDAHAIEAIFAVGKGTYVRALATELGRRVGVPAHLGALRRLAVGEHTLADPRLVADLCARPRPGVPTGAVVEHATLGRDRPALRAALVDRLVPLLDALRGAVARRPAGDRGLVRLTLGQALPETDLPELVATKGGWVVGPDVLVRVDIDAAPAALGRTAAARPVRVLRLGPPAAGGDPTA